MVDRQQQCHTSGGAANANLPKAVTKNATAGEILPLDDL